MDKEIFRLVLGKILLVILFCGLLIASIIYLNQRWAKIRDIRRQADAQSIIKALDFYNIQFGFYPDHLDDDGDGWDKSNDEENRTFLEPLIKIGLLPNLVFDPKNDASHYYRYQNFKSGEFDCRGNFAVFQITSFETVGHETGNGRCPDLNWVSLAPDGFTWLGQE